MSPKNQPTLMLGDLDLSVDCATIIEAVKAIEPHPVEIRYGRTRDTRHLNIFWQYASFEEARCVRRMLRQKSCAGVLLNLDFTIQEGEISLFISYNNRERDLTVFEIEQFFDKYPSVLSASSYYAKEERNNFSGTKTFFLRFRDFDDAVLAISEFGSVYPYNKLVYVSLSARNIDSAKEYVYERERLKMQMGIPAFHNLYTKKKVTMEEANSIVLQQEFDFQQDFENSRWSSLAYSEITHQQDYDLKMMYDYYHNCL